MTKKIEEGDLAIIKGTQIHVQVVGTTSKGYDVVRHVDHKVVKNVPREELETV